jgi:hypothetical protein
MYIWNGSGGLGSFSVFETLRGNKWWGGSWHYMSFIKDYMHSSFRQPGNHIAQLFKSSCKHIREICVGYWWYVIWSNWFSDQGFSDVVISSRKSEEKPRRGAVSTVRTENQSSLQGQKWLSLLGGLKLPRGIKLKSNLILVQFVLSVKLFFKKNTSKYFFNFFILLTY